MAENLLAWDVMIAAYNGRQFQVVQHMVVAPMGGAVMRPEVVGFRYEAILPLIDRMVPEPRRREVFEKFRWIEPYAVRAAGGGNAKGSDDQAGAQG
jgi:hypothetical protein